MADRLAGELLDAARGDGGAVRRKEEVAPHGRGQQGVRALPLVSGREPPIADI